MLPYASSGVYGGGVYGRRKGFLSSQNAILGVLALVAIAGLGFSVFTHFRASTAHAHKAAISNELDGTRSELHSIKSQFSSRNTELEQLQATYGHTQRRIMELTNQLQRKEAELVSKEQALQQQIKEKNVVDQHRSGREAELTKMVEDLRSELMRSDGVIEALDVKVATMESTHTSREKDWHILANKWIKYEQDLHDQYKKCTDEVSKLRNQTLAMNDTAPIPEAEPTLRPETDFGQIRTEVPVHKPHHFEPLLTPPADLPLPESKIRDSVIQMTGGQLGLEPGQQAPAAGAGATAPEPTQVHHHDVYHHDFHEDETAHLHNYDHYHGHYDSYDPVDEWWLQDGHGDWNADDHAARHPVDDTAAHDQHHYHHPEEHHQHQHHEHHPYEHHEQHHGEPQYHHQQEQHAPYEHPQQHHQYQEQHAGQHDGSAWAHPPQQAADPHQYHHPQPPAMQGMDQHAQHAPSHHWQQPDPHEHHQQQQQQQPPPDQYHHHQQQQQQQQQHGEAHNQQQQHPRGDLAYKMGW